MSVPIAREEIRLPKRKKSLFSTLGGKKRILQKTSEFFMLLTTLFATY
jgi:hypothetical protein